MLVSYASDSVGGQFDPTPTDATEEELELFAYAAAMPSGVEGLAEVALLLLEYAPRHALHATRRALREDSVAPLDLAVRLAALGTPWALREIVEAIPENHFGVGASFLHVLKLAGHEEAAREAESVASAVDPSSQFPEMVGMFDGLVEVMKLTIRNAFESDELIEWADRVRKKLGDFNPQASPRNEN